MHGEFTLKNKSHGYQKAAQREEVNMIQKCEAAFFFQDTK